ncbi:MAG: HAD family hydrolase, partial [Bdellovibrionota bacterium]
MKHLISNLSAKSTHPWIDTSVFDPMGQSELLQAILQRVKDESRARIRGGGKPVKVIFDLDSTVFDVKPRSLRILKEFALTPRSRELSPAISDWALSLTSYKLLYTLEESARANGIPATDEQARAYLKEAFRYWMARFFTHQYVTVDQPTPGAVDFANRVVDAGGVAVYLTGRDWPGMGRGTVTMLEHFGFPMHASTSQV